MPASAGGPLTAAQLAHFRVEGYVVLAGLVDLPSIERWRDDYWALLRTAVPRLDPNDDRTWPEDKSVFPALYGDRPTSDPRNGQRALYNFPLGSHPAVLAVVEQLGAGQLAETTSAESSCMLVWPRPDDESVATRPPPSSSDVAADRDAEGETGRMHPATRGIEALGTGHLDDYNNSWGWGGGFFLGITTCLTDVDRDGGGFTLFPRSHRAFHRYFRRHPERVDGSYNDHLLRGTPRGGFQHIFDAAMSDPVDPVRVGSPLQFCGRAGDTILWHGWLAHDGSPNLRRNQPRLAAITRWHHVGVQREDDRVIAPHFGREGRQGQVRYRVPEELFERWSAECRSSGGVPVPVLARPAL